jgi:hypothetical protein
MTLNATRDKSASFLKSNFFEQLVEHVFISELLQEAWFRYNKIVEVSRSEVDTSGYDLLLECNNVIRHVELKTSIAGARRNSQKINKALGEKPSGCVVWIIREEDEDTCRVKLKYLFFGNPPGEPLSPLETFKVAKHTKGNAHGVKKERPAIRQIPKSKFIEVSGIKELLEKLFGLPEE